MKTIINDQKPQDTPVQALPYHTPHLYVYGAMRELTTSGTGMEMEGMNLEMNKRP